MKKKLSITIVTVTANRLIRADFNGQTDEPVSSWSSPRSPRMQTPEAVRAALALGARVAPRVLVLCEDFWSQSVTLPAIQTDGLSPKETAEALRFEVEPFSNLAADAGAVGFRCAPQNNGHRTYWVVECTHAELAAIRDAVKRAGGRLAGVSHPGGIPMLLDGADPMQPWHRVEHWGRGALLVSSVGDHAGGVSIQNVAAGQLDNQRLSDAEHAEVLSKETDAVAASNSAVHFTLSEKSHLHRWLANWARCLNNKPSDLALIVPPPAVTPPHHYVLAGIAVEILLAAICLVHWRWSTGQRDSLRTEMAAIQQNVSLISGLENENAALRRSITEAQQQKKTQEDFSRFLTQRRQSLPVLLRSLAKAKPADILIQRMRDEGNGCLLVSGMSMSAGSVDELTTRLADVLQSSGWTVQPLQKNAQGILDNAGPWRFSIRVALVDALTGGKPGAQPSEGGLP